jgi:DnaJ-class molecular chaperone
MSPATKHRKCPTCIGIGYCEDGSSCPTCDGIGEVDYADDLTLPDDPCWNPT